MRRVLLIDDDDSIREVAQMSLEVIGGWTVSTADNGADGAELAAAEQPDVILLDLMMPGIDGVATLSLLREEARTQDIPVIFLTAKLHSADQARWASMPVAGVLEKPFDPLRLPSEIARVLGWSS